MTSTTAQAARPIDTSKLSFRERMLAIHTRVHGEDELGVLELPASALGGVGVHAADEGRDGVGLNDDEKVGVNVVDGIDKLSKACNGADTKVGEEAANTVTHTSSKGGDEADDASSPEPSQTSQTAMDGDLSEVPRRNGLFHAAMLSTSDVWRDAVAAVCGAAQIGVAVDAMGSPKFFAVMEVAALGNRVLGGDGGERGGRTIASTPPSSPFAVKGAATGHSPLRPPPRRRLSLLKEGAGGVEIENDKTCFLHLCQTSVKSTHQLLFWRLSRFLWYRVGANIMRAACAGRYSPVGRTALPSDLSLATAHTVFDVIERLLKYAATHAPVAVAGSLRASPPPPSPPPPPPLPSPPVPTATAAAIGYIWSSCRSDSSTSSSHMFATGTADTGSRVLFIRDI